MWLNPSTTKEGSSTQAAHSTTNERSTNTHAQPLPEQTQLDTPAVEDSEEEEFMSVVGDFPLEGSTGAVSSSVWDGRLRRPWSSERQSETGVHGT